MEEKFRIILESILSSKLQNLKSDLLLDAIKYARIRADWQLAERGERNELEDIRHSAHEVFINSCNILSRNMYQNGEDNAWRTKLGNDRITIGDFACFIHYYLGLQAR